MEDNARFGEVFDGPLSAALCVLATAAYAVVHFLLPSGAACNVCRSSRGFDAAVHPAWILKCYRRKLRRMLLHCCLISVLGVILFARALAAANPMEELCCTFSALHQVIFAVVIGHWTVNLWEDWCTRSFLGQGLKSDTLSLFPLNLFCEPRHIMFLMYFVHHVVTVVAYCYSLATHRLGGLMVQGLLFEVPVAFMLRRELAQSMEDLPAWLGRPRAVAWHWALTCLAFVAGRGPAEVLWVWSFIPGERPDKLFSNDRNFDPLARVMYHTLGVFFTALNIRILGLYVSWYKDDIKRARQRWAVDPEWGAPNGLPEDVKKGDDKRPLADESSDRISLKLPIASWQDVAGVQHGDFFPEGEPTLRDGAAFAGQCRGEDDHRRISSGPDAAHTAMPPNGVYAGFLAALDQPAQTSRSPRREDERHCDTPASEVDFVEVSVAGFCGARSVTCCYAPPVGLG